MARKNPLPAREIEICNRLRAFREKTKLSRVAFAETIKIDSSFLSNLEHCRAPLRYQVAFSICLNFGIDPKWLATGVGDEIGDTCLPHYESLGVDPRMLFSYAYDELLAYKYSENNADLNRIPFHFDPDSPQRYISQLLPYHRFEAMHFIIDDYLMEWFARVPDRNFNHFYDTLVETGKRLLEKKYPHDPEDQIKERRKNLLKLEKEYLEVKMSRLLRIKKKKTA